MGASCTLSCHTEDYNHDVHHHPAVADDWHMALDMTWHLAPDEMKLSATQERAEYLSRQHSIYIL